MKNKSENIRKRHSYKIRRSNQVLECLRSAVRTARLFTGMSLIKIGLSCLGKRERNKAYVNLGAQLTREHFRILRRASIVRRLTYRITKLNFIILGQALHAA